MVSAVGGDMDGRARPLAAEDRAVCNSSFPRADDERARRFLRRNAAGGLATFTAAGTGWRALRLESREGHSSRIVAVAVRADRAAVCAGLALGVSAICGAAFQT